MRTRRLLGTTLAVLALHLAGLQVAHGGPPHLAPPRAGVRHVTLVSATRRAEVPAPSRQPAATTAANAPLRLAAGPALPAAHAGMPPRRTLAHAARPHDAGAPARAGAGGTSRITPADARSWPVYPTRPPPSLTLRYALVQTGAASSATGEAALEWRRDAAAFSLRVSTAVPGRPAREWQSTGAFDRAGVAPWRLVERERGRDKRALSIDPGGGQVRFPGAAGTREAAVGVQDRWSWIAQLAAVAEAEAGARRGRLPARWDLQVAGLRGELEHWTFQILPPGEPPPELRPPGKEPSSAEERAPALLHVLHVPEQPYHLRVEAWLSPALHHLPAGLRLSTPPGPWSLSLWQRDP